MADSPIGSRNIWPNYAPGNVSAASERGSNKQLGKDDFLKILLTQLQNQDPLQPMEDKEFIAQMAQFSSVEQLSNISTEISLMRQSLASVSGLIGKQVSWINTSSTGSDNLNSGVVEAIAMRNGQQFAMVNGESIALKDLVGIANAPEESGP
jgi:flagellar basal-body rod modification protein FlgD